ncbi:hypothetical protein SAMN03159284_01043 [Mucilaginibacter sp. NFR10]|nr:hypothetical protein SAMN03159284_01043 [Mucilaginibacter sp. NFR10]
MKYKYAPLFLFLLLSCKMFAQQPERRVFYDVLYLKSLYDKDGKIRISPQNKPLFAYYFNLKNTTNVDTVIKKNPFFNLNGIYEAGGASGGTIPSPSGLLQSIGSLDVTNLADGLAKFLVERTKQELSTAFFSRFKKELDSTRQLQLLFPVTYKSLTAIDVEIYNYAAYTDLLRESFQKDLALLLPNVSNLIDDPCMDQLFAAMPHVRIIFIDALYIANEFHEGSHPGDIFHNYLVNKAGNGTLKLVNENVYPALQAFDLFSQSLRSNQRDKYWVDADSAKMLFSNPVTFQIYLGLLYQQLEKKDINFKEGSMKQFLKDRSGDFLKFEEIYQSYNIEFIQKATIVNRYFINLKQLQQKGENTFNYQDYYALYNSSLNLFEQLLKSPLLLNVDPANITIPMIDRKDTKIDQYLSSARSLGNVYIDVYEKQYPSAIVELSGVYDNLFINKVVTNPIKQDLVRNLADKKAEYDKLQDAVVKTAIKKEINELEAKIAAFTEWPAINKMFIKYANFAAEVSKAKNSDEVKNAIEAIALPVGSSTVKREVIFNVALNAYVGPYVGEEKVHGIDEKYKGTYGLSAPVGISFSWGHRLLFVPTGDKKWSTSVFVSLIDIGALASYRFTSGSTPVAKDTSATVAQVPKIELKNIISPGLFLSVGIPSTPISISGGFQVAPNLRSVSLTGANKDVITNTYGDNKLYTRWSVGVLVDIPILNLFTKGR